MRRNWKRPKGMMSAVLGMSSGSMGNLVVRTNEIDLTEDCSTECQKGSHGEERRTHCLAVGAAGWGLQVCQGQRYLNVKLCESVQWLVILDVNQ